jgi:predicted negative regulator of RcsB-dependent stress response
MRERFSTRAARLVLCAAATAACASMSTLAQDGPMTGRIAYVEPAGKLKVQQRNSKVLADATPGMLVRRSYLLDLDPGARAAVRCADGNLHQVEPGRHGCPCVASAAGEIYKGLSSPRTGGADTQAGAFPVVISPRGTLRGMLLLTTRPTIRWSPVATPSQGPPVEYQVGIYGEGMKPVWEKKVSSVTEMEYPAGEKSLTRGKVYKVVVEGAGRSSQDEVTAWLGFTVMTDAQAKDVGDAETRIRGRNLPAVEAQLLIADLYAARGLSSEAIEKLDALKGALNQPWVLLMLGDLYAAEGLHREAIAQYDGALALLQTGKDPEAQALALAALGRSYLSMGRFTEANSIFPRAQNAYRGLGVNVSIEQLKKGTIE